MIELLGSQAHEIAKLWPEIRKTLDNGQLV